MRLILDLLLASSFNFFNSLFVILVIPILKNKDAERGENKKTFLIFLVFLYFPLKSKCAKRREMFSVLDRL